MSVIAAWKGEIGSDSMGICETTGVWLPQQKIFVYNRELAIAVCGNSMTPSYVNRYAKVLSEIIALMEANDSTIATPLLPEGTDDQFMSIYDKFLKSLADLEMYIMTKNHRYFVKGRDIVRFNTNVPLVAGSGGYVASTALLLGFSMVDSITTAIQIAPLVRGEPVIYKQRDLVKLRRPKALLTRIALRIEVL